jgi:PPK2 family polyphosphate:nucleotide phosphotransferase
MRLPVDTADYLVRPGEPCRLAERATVVAALSANKSAYRARLGEYRNALRNLQAVLYADGRWSVLLIVQGMDTSGKDGAIKHVMSGVNPQGTQVVSFGPPSSEDLRHDFLWRAHHRLPERGRIGIFNRSYYEEVLIVRVEPDVLKAQGLPPECVDPRTIWRDRHRDIVNFEDYLVRNGTRIVKVYLHLSKEEQKQRLLARIDDPTKNWKLSPSDLRARGKWDAYIEAYQDCLAATSTERAPWFVVPGDNKRNARLIISKILLETLESIPMRIPEASEAHREELAEVRRILESEPPVAASKKRRGAKKS